MHTIWQWFNQFCLITATYFSRMDHDQVVCKQVKEKISFLNCKFK
jgi:hypothetical protein